MAKTHDICLAVGEYTDQNGDKKKRYKTIGALMDSEHGPYLLLDADVLSMQLFALANRERRDSVLVSLFDANRERGASKPAATSAEDVPY